MLWAAGAALNRADAVLLSGASTGITMAGQGREINLGTLPLEQLNQLKEQLESETQELTQNYAGLMNAQSRFAESKRSMNALTPGADGKAVLVPLTQSLYVPGRLSDTRKVLVDIGTGYYVEKTVEKAKQFMDRKVKFLEQNTNSLGELIGTKQKNLKAVVQVMQMRMQQQQMAQAEGGEGGSS